MGESLIAYTDESGNTGLNIFDDEQPDFWTGTLLTGQDLEGPGAATVKDCCERLGVEELHGNQLGIGRIEQIAPSIIDLIVQNDCQFIFTRVEKRHVARTKLVDMLLDPDINEAVLPLHYNSRGLRLPLALYICEHLSPQAEESFWSVFRAGDETGLLDILRRLRWNLQNKVDDKRVREILVRTIDWALDNPSKILFKRRDETDSPNVIGLLSLIQSIHHLTEDTGVSIGKFVHDEQNQFAKCLSDMYEIAKGFRFSMSTTSLATDFEKIETFKGVPLELGQSTLVGLQLIDVILWLIKRTLVQSDLPQGIEKLVGLVLYKGVVSDFSKNQLAADVERVFETVAELGARDPKLEAKGRQIIEQMEAQRESGE